MLRVPGMGTMNGFCASSHASAIWAGVASFFAANCFISSTTGVFAARRSHVHDHKHRRGDSGPVAGQRADHHSAWGCGAAGQPAAIPVLRIRRRVAVPPRRPPLTAVPFVRSGGKPPHPPERTLGSGQTLLGRRWRMLGSGPPDRPAIFGNRFRCRHRESMWRLALRGRRHGFCRGRIRRRNGCPVPPNHSPPRRRPRCSISIGRLSR